MMIGVTTKKLIGRKDLSDYQGSTSYYNGGYIYYEGKR